MFQSFKPPGNFSRTRQVLVGRSLLEQKFAFRLVYIYCDFKAAINGSKSEIVPLFIVVVGSRMED